MNPETIGMFSVLDPVVSFITIFIIGVILIVILAVIFISRSSSNIKKEWISTLVDRELEERKICVDCGAFISLNSNFCHECGKNI